MSDDVADVISTVEAFFGLRVTEVIRVPYHGYSATGDGKGGVRLWLPDRYGPLRPG